MNEQLEIEGRDLAALLDENARLRAALAAAKAVDAHFGGCHQCGADLRGNVWYCRERDLLRKEAVRLRDAALPRE